MTMLRPLTAADLPPASELPVQVGLPDPLLMRDGSRVTTAEEWRTKRRPELLQLFQTYMYGIAPAAPEIAAKVTKPATPILDGKAILKEVEIRFIGWPEEAPRLHLALFLPAKARQPVPVFLSLNKCGNQEVLEDEAITVSENAWKHANCEKVPRGGAKDFWCVETLIARGYGLALFHESDLDPDKHDFTDGVHPYASQSSVPAESRWGTIAAWAWGLQRAVDYLVTDPQIDAKRICLIGHSRRGKTALWAAALDERVALVVPHQSGTGGMALSRDSQQETVERINRVFPHWFNDAFCHFNNNEAQLPFDQHCLVACIAPRPLLDTEGRQDAWANFPRSLESLKGATPVYEMLGVQGLVGSGLVTDDDPIAGVKVGHLLQCRLKEKHTLNAAFWEKILDFADAKLVQ